MSKNIKRRAILAYNQGLLSDRARKRVEEHLRTSEEAREFAATDRLYGQWRQQAAQATEESIAQVDWSRMDLALQREARRQTRSNAPLLILGAIAVAAAALLAVMRFGPSDREEFARPKLEAPGPGAITGQVTAIAGEVFGTPEGRERRALSVGDRVPSLMRIETGAGAQVHVKLWEETGFFLAEETSVLVAPDHPLHGQDARIALARGSITSRVAPLDGESARYEIESGAHLVRVLGTHFGVTRNDDDVAVRILEGRVEILFEGKSIAIIDAPGEWSSRGPVSGNRLHDPNLPPGEPDGWGLVHLPPVTAATHWQLADR
ncbi:MAG: FecR domain-containing protein, partial [Myxococcales bacterium]|nr:FecR domain-containing protein [Myxococcales bacterium]